MASDKLKILVCVHKKDFFLNDDVYMPIHVGKAISGLDLGISGDNIGENISAKNKSYCELTGLYWAWKNMMNNDVSYIGLCHYRRYFKFVKGPFNIRRFLPVTAKGFERADLLTSNVESILGQYDIIIAKPLIFRYSLAFDYNKRHIGKDLMALEGVIKELTPEYMPAFHEVINNGNRLSPCNMFVTNKDILNDYCTWLFTILQELETRIDLSGYDPVQARIWGYMGERLLNVYVRKNKLRVKYCPITGIDDNAKKKSMLRYCWPVLRNLIGFSISKMLNKHIVKL